MNQYNIMNQMILCLQSFDDSKTRMIRRVFIENFMNKRFSVVVVQRNEQNRTDISYRNQYSVFEWFPTF